jgi:hypothetical protein
LPLLAGLTIPIGDVYRERPGLRSRASVGLPKALVRSRFPHRCVNTGHPERRTSGESTLSTCRPHQAIVATVARSDSHNPTRVDLGASFPRRAYGPLQFGP